MNLRRAHLALITLGFLLAWPAFAAGDPAEFEAANKLYEQGKFAEAATAYQKLADSGSVSGALYYNLGNARFKAGQVGRALAAYQEASRLTPRDPDLRANIRFARNQVQGPTLTPGRVQSWIQRLTVDEWTALASSSIWAIFLLLTAGQVRPAWRAPLRPWLLAGFAACALLVFGASLANHFERNIRIAVVLGNGTAVRKGPIEESPVAFTANSGAELQVIDKKDLWVRVQATPSQTGWVPVEKLIMVHP